MIVGYLHKRDFLYRNNFISALISGISSLFGSGITSSQSHANMVEQNKFNAEQAQIDREWRESMWNKENAYNTPSAQMARLKEAGLNPNLVYGQGGSFVDAAVPSGSQARAAETQRVYFDPATAIATALQALQVDNQTKQTKQNIENQKTENDLKKEEVRGKQIENDILESSKQDKIDIIKSEREYKYYQSLVEQERSLQELTKTNQYQVELQQAKVNLDYLEKEKDLNIKETEARINQINEFTMHQTKLMDSQAYLNYCNANQANIQAQIGRVELEMKKTDQKFQVINIMNEMAKDLNEISNLVKQGKLLEAQDLQSKAQTKYLKASTKLKDKESQYYLNDIISKLVSPVASRVPHP